MHAPSVRAQGDETPDRVREGVDVRVVNVDVVATDKQGRPVTDLTRDDFRLLVDGREVEVEYFVRSPGSQPAAGEPAQTTEGAPVEAVEEGVLVAIYVDDYWLTPPDRLRVLGDLEQYAAAELAAGRRVLVATHGRSLEVRRLATDGAGGPPEVFAEIAAKPPLGFARERERRSAYDSIRGLWELHDEDSPGAYCREPCECWEQMLGVWQIYADETTDRIRRSYGGILELLAALGGLPERKAVIYVGSGFDQRPGLDLLQHLIDLCPVYERELGAYLMLYDESSNLLDLGAAANSSRATLYPVDAGGLRGQGSADVGEFDVELRPSALVSQIERANVQAPFQILASAAR
jgi:VWFA-related protein